jgi:ATP-dependent DNA helicase RecG
LEHDSEHLTAEHEGRLMELAAEARSKGKIPKSIMELTILELCNNQWLSLRTLARLLGRDPDSLRNHYINPMLKNGRLQARVPGKPNHPNQAYQKKVTS